MSLNNDVPAKGKAPQTPSGDRESSSPFRRKTGTLAPNRPLGDSDSSAPVNTVEKEDLIPAWLLIGIFAVVMALTLFLLKDNWVTDMTRFRSLKAQKQGDWPAAVRHLESLVKSGEEAGITEVSLSPTYLSELGYSHFHMKKYDKALEYFQKAQANRANLPPDEQGNPRPPVDFNTMIGMVQYNMGDLAGAKTSLQAALKFNKLDMRANFTMGEIAMKEDKYTEAASYFKVVAGTPAFEKQVKAYYAEIEKELFAGIT